jgi:hypothetical protein
MDSWKRLARNIDNLTFANSGLRIYRQAHDIHMYILKLLTRMKERGSHSGKHIFFKHGENLMTSGDIFSHIYRQARAISMHARKVRLDLYNTEPAKRFF